MTPQDRQILLTFAAADHTADLKFRAAVHAVLLRVDELEADAARLDWLADQTQTVGPDLLLLLVGFEGDDPLRAMIDRAMKGDT